MAASTSPAVTLRAASCTGSSQTRMANCAAAEYLRVADAFDRREARLHHLRQELRHLLRVHRGGADGDIHQREFEAGALHDDRVLRVDRQLPAHLLHLGEHVDQRLVGVGVELHVDRDGARAERARRGDVVDVVGVQHRLGDRRGDEALHQAGAGAGIDGGDRDDRFLDLRIFAHRHVEEALQAEQQDEDRGDERQDRPADEGLGEIHGVSSRRRAPPPPDRRCC